MTRVPRTRSRPIAGLCALLAALLLAPPLLAQSVTFGALSGRVTDGAGAPLREVEVRLVDRSSGAERTAITGSDGRFRFPMLSAARYDVNAEAIGYRPLVHVGVNVEPGRAVGMTMQLRPATPPVVVRDTILARGSTVVPLSWLAERGYADVAGGRRVLSDIAALSPFADPDGIEGLPWRLAEVVVDGARVGGAPHPGSAGGETIGLAFPTRGIADASAGGVGFDVEMSGSGTGLMGTSARGGRAPSWRSVAEGGTSGIGAAITVGGTVQQDTAQAIAGADYQRGMAILPALFQPADADGLQLADIAATRGVDLSQYTRESERLEERWSGHARFDWLQGDRFALAFRASGSNYVLADPSYFGARSAGIGTRQKATAANATVNVLARVTSRIAVELRVSGDAAESRAAAAPVPPTTFAGRGLTIGGDQDEPYNATHTTPRATGMLHWELGAHRLKAGFALASHRIASRHTPGAVDDFSFGDGADFAALSGVYRRVAPDAGAAAFRLNESALFVQDAWAVTDALLLTAGLRFDGYTLPAAARAGNADWRAASGFDAGTTEGRTSRVAPRVGFRWGFGEDRAWVLQGGAGVFNDVPARDDLAEAISLGRGAEVELAAGALGSWPAAPPGRVSAGRTVSLLGPRFEAPRTQRLTLSLQRSAGAWTTYASGVYRHTDLLVRRTDLNLPAAAVGEDQYGRPLHGRLQQVGSLLVADMGSNRRFAGFDAVHALDVTGYSDFSAVSVGVDRVVDQGISLALNYTYATTEDNLAGQGARLAPFAPGFGGDDWSDGVADRAAPHRGLVALEWTPSASGQLRIGAVYRVRSGAPYTPGFRAGVDANGDGDGYNDPAFVDPAASGMTALLEAHPCLRRQSGAFAARNSCHGDYAQRLDLRATLRLMRGPGMGLDLVLDAMDVVSVATGRRDAALFLVDRTGAVSTNPLTGVTTVPLTVNPRFGEILADRSPGVLWRVGVRIGR